MSVPDRHKDALEKFQASKIKSFLEKLNEGQEQYPLLLYGVHQKLPYFGFLDSSRSQAESERILQTAAEFLESIQLNYKLVPYEKLYITNLEKNVADNIWQNLPEDFRLA